MYIDKVFKSFSVSVFTFKEETISLMKIINSRGDSGSPCFRPNDTLKKSDTSIDDVSLIQDFTSLYSDFMICIILQLIPDSISFTHNTSR